MPGKVKVVIDPKTGIMTTEVEGVAGGACLDITKALTEGKQVLEHQITSEMCETQDRPDYVSDLDGGASQEE